MGSITHIDCFSGAGGITTGFKAAGIETILAIEKVESCVDTFHANHPSVPIIHKDIRSVEINDIQKIITSDVDIITAGMPCETFSTAGSKSRSFYDDRQTLYREAIRLAAITNAKIILFENVPGITTKKISRGNSKFVIEELFETLAEFNFRYHVDTIINAADFGVPQLRERYFILASKEDLKLKFPVSKTNHRVTVNDALKGLPLISANGKIKKQSYTKQSSDYTKLLRDNSFWHLDNYSEKLTYHIAPKHRKCTIERFSYINQGEGLKDLFLKLDKRQIQEFQLRKVLPNRWYIQRNRRLIANNPSVTLTSHCLDELIHPTLNRALSIREVARLQSFPDSYDFKGGPFICPHIYETQDKYEQIGDSVPPLLAFALGRAIQEILEEQQ